MTPWQRLDAPWRPWMPHLHLKFTRRARCRRRHATGDEKEREPLRDYHPAVAQKTRGSANRRSYHSSWQKSWEGQRWICPSSSWSRKAPDPPVFFAQCPEQCTCARGARRKTKTSRSKPHYDRTPRKRENSLDKPVPRKTTSRVTLK